MSFWTLKDKQILIVDDFPAMRSMMRSMLTAYGANKIVEAKNGEEAVECMAQQTMELVTCDYNLGAGKNGQQVLEEAKERELLPYSSVFIMTTAENTPDMVMGAVEYQPDDYLVKPFTKTVLQARLRKIEERKQDFKEISTALGAKNYHRTIELCDQQLNTSGRSSGELTKLKGELLLKIGDHDAAKQWFEAALASRDLIWAQFGLAQAQFHLKEYEQARFLLETILQQNNKFIAAYDWLAKTYKALGNSLLSQETLQDAVKISPKAILRNKALGEIALENKDYDTAEKAYKSVVRDGKNSIHHNPNDYGGLAKVYLKKEAPKEALKVVDNMSKQFKTDDHTAQFQTAVVETLVYKETGQDDQSRAALERVMKHYQTNPSALPSSAAIEVATVCYAMGKKEQGDELIKHVVRNNHEDEKMIAHVKEALAKAGQKNMDDIVESTRQEVVATNNKGVELAKQGKLQESIGLLMQAARAMPENLTVNLNAALSLILAMQSSGPTERSLNQAQIYLDRVGRIDPAHERYKKMMKTFRELSKAASDATKKSSPAGARS